MVTIPSLQMAVFLMKLVVHGVLLSELLCDTATHHTQIIWEWSLITSANFNRGGGGVCRGRASETALYSRGYLDGVSKQKHKPFAYPESKPFGTTALFNVEFLHNKIGYEISYEVHFITLSMGRRKKRQCNALTFVPKDDATEVGSESAAHCT